MIYLIVGELSGVVKEAVDFYFSFLSRDTIAENASLFYMHIPAQLRCRNCNAVFSPEKLDFHCPSCNEQQVEIISGRELIYR
jgi:hydrogenase nickel incorporation protein HypA/HybF